MHFFGTHKCLFHHHLSPLHLPGWSPGCWLRSFHLPSSLHSLLPRTGMVRAVVSNCSVLCEEAGAVLLRGGVRKTDPSNPVSSSGLSLHYLLLTPPAPGWFWELIKASSAGHHKGQDLGFHSSCTRHHIRWMTTDPQQCTNAQRKECAVSSCNFLLPLFCICGYIKQGLFVGLFVLPDRAVQLYFLARCIWH